MTIEYFIDRKARAIWSRETISRRRVRGLSEAEVRAHLDDPSIAVYQNSEWDNLTLLVRDEVLSKWDDHFAGHIAGASEEADPGDFDDGYGYLAELWKGFGGRPIIVLYYHH